MELLESDVMWPEDEEPARPKSIERSGESEVCIDFSWRQKRTAPMGIPAAASSAAARMVLDFSESGPEKEEMVPPHVMVSRRWSSASLAFSLTSRSGRTLKGRDLAHVRNSVLRMTGFLEN